MSGDHEFDIARAAMMDTLMLRGIRSKRVLSAMRAVKRHCFVPEPYRSRFNPYGDYPGPIGCEQTISQPFIVAYMIEKLDLKPGDRVLEVGTGCGYQAAVLAEMGAEVVGIEVRSELATMARINLEREGYGQVKVIVGDGYEGFAGMAPYDAIIVACAPPVVPCRLVEQLGEGGRMIVPAGEVAQKLIIITRHDGIVSEKEDIGVVFVPMIRG